MGNAKRKVGRLPAATIYRAEKILRAGGVIVYPTDTAYAVGGVFNRPAVIRRVIEIKGPRRRGNKKFTLVASSLAQVERYFNLPRAARQIAQQHWPGPCSIVVSKSFAVRVPASPMARTLARRAGAPLVATSANRSGGRTPYSVRAALRQLRGRIQPDFVVDVGRLPKRKTSTIVRVDEHGTLTVVRNGAVRISPRLPA